MQISHVIAHYLHRDTDSDANLVLKKNEIAIGPQTEKLLDSLKKSFKSRLTRQHGSFTSEDTKALLKGDLLKFVDNEQSVLELSTHFMRQLEKEVNEKGIEINSHFLFFIEESSSQQFFYLFIANQNESLAIDETLDVTSNYSIDTGATLSGLKIDLDEWQKNRKYPYITLVPPKGNILLSEALLELWGFDNSVDKEEATTSFLQGVEAFTKHVPEENIKEYRTKIVEHCIEQEQKDEPVNIPGLSKELNGIDCEKFVREMLSHNPKQDSETEEDIMIDRRSLKKYVRFSGREKDLAISFSSFQLNERVFYDEANDTLSIKGLPKVLRNQLLNHLKQN